MERLNPWIGGDYSRPRDRSPHYRPHDLLRIAPAALGSDVPAWARAVIARSEPVVVRRGRRDGASLPIGIRGATRDRRHAARVPARHILGRPTTPEALVAAHDPARARCVPALAVLTELRAAMMAWTGAWGIGGAVGYELASGAAACHADSDIDVILRLPAVPEHSELNALAERLAALPVRCDVQLETPAGGVALTDWLSDAPRVLIKSDPGPYLAVDPWNPRTGCGP